MSIDVYLTVPSRIAGMFKQAIDLIEQGRASDAAGLLKQFMDDEAKSVADDAVDMVEEIYQDNCTANLCDMWRKAGIIDALYTDEPRPASDVADVLEEGLSKMLADREDYEALNPANGWGDYHGAIRFLKNLIAACRKNPTATYDRW